MTRGGIADLRSEIGAAWGPPQLVRFGREDLGISVGNHDLLPFGYYRWPIEIDGLPINSMVIFHGALLNNQMLIDANCSRYDMK